MSAIQDRTFADVRPRFKEWDEAQALPFAALPLSVQNAMAGVMLAYIADGGDYPMPGSPLFRAFVRLTREAYTEGFRRGKTHD